MLQWGGPTSYPLYLRSAPLAGAAAPEVSPVYVPTSPYLLASENRIRLDQIPFSDRGSRLLLYQDRRQPDTLYLKLAERLTAPHPRALLLPAGTAPFIPRSRLVDGEGRPVPFSATTYPHAIVFQTPLGEFRAVFQDEHTLSFGLPTGVASGISFTVVPDLARPDARGGEFKSVRNCAYSTNGELVLNQVEHSGNGYEVTLTAVGDADAAIILHIQGGLDLGRAVTPFRATLAAAEGRWHRWFAAVPSVHEPYRAQYYYAWWVLGNNILALRLLPPRAWPPAKPTTSAPGSGTTTSTPWPSATPTRSWPATRTHFMLDHQLPDGMIPDAVYDEGTITQLELPRPPPSPSRRSSPGWPCTSTTRRATWPCCATSTSRWCAGTRGGSA